jgi:predicted aspartyl protease
MERKQKMQIKQTRKPFRWLALMIAITMVAFISSPGYAFQIEIENNKISVAANRVPLQDLLRQIATDNDIMVRMDPAINHHVQASFNNRGLEDGLKTILKPHNYALIWKSNPKFQGTPSDPAYTLTEIHVYRPGQKSKMINIGASFVKTPTETQDETETQDVLETNVTIKDNRVYVPVILGYEDKEIHTTLLFDTGASSIVLHQNVADQLEIDDLKDSQGEGVGGVMIPTQTTWLNYVIVGTNKKENLRASIVDYHGSGDENYNGLLGMNFLKGLKYTIDFDSQTIQWDPTP